MTVPGKRPNCWPSFDLSLRCWQWYARIQVDIAIALDVRRATREWWIEWHPVAHQTVNLCETKDNGKFFANFSINKNSIKTYAEK